MRSLRTLTPILLVAFSALAAPFARALALTPNDARIVSLSVVPAAGHADAVVRVDGNVTLKHFTLSNPDKIVLDLTGATLGFPAGVSYDGVPRGGITSVRYSQFSRTVVRVVLTLDAPHQYDVTADDGAIRISVATQDQKFAPWSIGGERRAVRGAMADAKGDVKLDSHAAAPSPAAAPAVAPAVAPAAAPAVTPAAAPARVDTAPKAAAPARVDSAPKAAAPARVEKVEKVEKADRDDNTSSVAAVVSQAGTPMFTASDTREDAAAERRARDAQRAVLNAQQQRQEPCITVNFEASPISDVLAAFSAFTGRTILPSKNVQGTVTANIICQPWDVALKAVMNANGYDVTLNPEGILIVDTFESLAARQQTTQAMVPLNTRNVRLNYARSTSVARMVEVRLTRTCATAALSGQQQQQPQNFNIPNANNQQPAPGQPVAQSVPQQQPQVGVVMSLQCPTRGAVTADTITNSISITDVPSALNDLEQYARSLDIRQPQVNIKAKIILVDRSTLEGLGLRYDLGSREQFFNDIVPRLDSLGQPLTTAGQILLGGNTVSAIANATARVPGAALQLVYSTAMGNFDFTTFLEALQNNTLLDVQAEPSVTVLNNRTANITAGTQVPVRVIDAGSAAGNTSNAPRATVQMQQTGIILTVTPQITNNRQIQMKVHVENSDVQFQASDVGAVFPRQSVDNETLVADGETMVVGGLTQTTVSISRTGLPILVDLPIIGPLFGVTNRNETKRDLLILITPHIVDEGQPSPDSGRP